MVVVDAVNTLSRIPASFRVVSGAFASSSGAFPQANAIDGFDCRQLHTAGLHEKVPILTPYPRATNSIRVGEIAQPGPKSQR
jgi:hypothetical protein